MNGFDFSMVGMFNPGLAFNFAGAGSVQVE